VKAAPHSASYRLKKLLSRHRALSSAVATVLLGSLFLAGLMGGLALKERLDAIDARLETNRAQEVSRFLAGAYRESQPGTAAADVLRAAVGRLGMHIDGEPQWYDSARLALGEALVGAGAHADAGRLLERVVNQNERSSAEMNPDRVQAMALLGEALLGDGRPADAAAWYRKALDGRLQLGSEPMRTVPSRETLERGLNAALQQSAAR
jgi:hypothetical protein